MGELNFRRKRRKTKKPAVKEVRMKKVRMKGPKPKEVLWWSTAILIVCMAAVFLVAAFGQKVNVTGDSMSPTLRNGDTVLVNHFIYNIKDPARGDIAVYQKEKKQAYYVKRIVGIPGDTVQIADGALLINGKKAEMKGQTYIEYAGLAEKEIKLKKDEYFVLGDNAGASEDSRVASVGTIKKEELFGCVWRVIDRK